MKLELLYWQSGTSKQREENKEELEQANKIKANNYIKLNNLRSELKKLYPK